MERRKAAQLVLVAGLATLALTIAMSWRGRAEQRSAADCAGCTIPWNGMVRFEIATSQDEVLAALGPAGEPCGRCTRRVFDVQNRIDLGFLVAYSALNAAVALFLFPAARAGRDPRRLRLVLRLTLCAAGAMLLGDLAETLALLHLTGPSPVFDSALAVLVPATRLKWGALTVACFLLAWFYQRAYSHAQAQVRGLGRLLSLLALPYLVAGLAGALALASGDIAWYGRHVTWLAYSWFSTMGFAALWLLRSSAESPPAPSRPSNAPTLLAVTLALFGSGAAQAGETKNPPRPAAIELTPCTLPGVSRPARCGALEVPENPELPAGRRLSIGVAVVPAQGGRALSDPIAVLMGGPGEDAISAASYFADQLAPLLADRDLLLVDQRGTGRSGALRCDLAADGDEVNLRDFFSPAAVERCARLLGEGADLTQYTYAHFAADLEQVRRALGYGPLNLSAGSYGTRAAQVYLRAFPASVRTVYLGSVVPIDVATPLTFAKTMDGALESTFAACAAEPACQAAFPHLRDEFRQILSRLDEGAVRVAIPGHAGTVRLHRGRVVEWLRSGLYRPATAALVPWWIHRAFEGDWSAIVDGILTNTRERDSAISLGLFFAITCSEDIPFVCAIDVPPATTGTALGDYRLRQQQAACEHFPRAALPDGYRTPVRSAVPTLFVSGDIDSGSPLWFTEHAAPGFAERVEVVLRGRGHTEWSDCVGELYRQLVRSGSVRGLDPALCKPVSRPPFKIR